MFTCKMMVAWNKNYMNIMRGHIERMGCTVVERVGSLGLLVSIPSVEVDEELISRYRMGNNNTLGYISNNSIY